MRISIVIPVLNEAAIIGPFLRRLRQSAPDVQLIVVDGGSSDDTGPIAGPLCDRVITTSPGRATQMNSGAAAADGQVLWFLHADTEIPSWATTRIETALQDRGMVGGFFRIRLPKENWIYRLTDGFAHYAGLAMRMRCGDHGIFCRRSVFEELGGYANVELMEDVEFFRRLRRCGRLAIIPDRLIVSPRRYEEIGPLRLTLAFGLIGLLYFFRAPPRWLQRLYRRTCCRSRHGTSPSGSRTC